MMIYTILVAEEKDTAANKNQVIGKCFFPLTCKKYDCKVPNSEHSVASI
jgi:hypothetical protein